MLAKEQTSPPPKAVNIIRPSSPFLQQLKRAVSPNLATPHDASQSSSTASSSSPSTLSTLSSGAGGRFGAASLFSFYAPQHKPILGPNRFLQRPRSNSNLSKITSFSSSSDEEEEEEGDDDDSDEIDSIDGNTDNEDEEDDDDDDDDDDENDNDAEEEQVSPSKIVARIKHGTIMNGRGEFVSKGSDDGWLDEARANRKIADLEIEKTSLLAVNKTLEATVRRQAERILELEKRLEINNNNNNSSSSNNNNNSNDGPLTPLSDKHVGDESPLQETTSDEELENDQVFQRLKTMLQTLIDQAEAALIQKSKISGRVLTDYNPSTEARRKSVSKNEDDDAVTIRKLAVRRSWSPTHGSNTAIMNRQHQRPPRRGSDSQDIRPRSPRPVINHTKTSMARTLSRSSSPAVMVSSPTPPASPITRSHSPVPFNNTMHVRPPSRTSSLRSGHSNHHHHQQQQQPRWQY